MCFLGLTGLCVALGYSAYKYKHRGSMKTSVFLMQTRVVAQGQLNLILIRLSSLTSLSSIVGAVVVALTAGVATHMFNKWILHGGKDDDE